MRKKTKKNLDFIFCEHELAQAKHKGQLVIDRQVIVHILQTLCSAFRHFCAWKKKVGEISVFVGIPWKEQEKE